MLGGFRDRVLKVRRRHTHGRLVDGAERSDQLSVIGRRADGYERREHGGVVARAEWQAMIEIPKVEGAVGRTKTQRNLACGQRVAIGLTENRHQNLAIKLALCRMPVDVEISRVPCVLPPFEDVKPPWIVGFADTHVVRHEIEDETQPVHCERAAKAGEAVVVADLRIEAVIIDDVVAMRAASARLEKRRGVDVADTERCKIGRERGSVVEGEIAVELEPVGRDRNVERRHLLIYRVPRGRSARIAARISLATGSAKTASSSLPSLRAKLG